MSQALDDQKEKLDRETMLQGKNMSEDEFEQLLAQHRRNQEAIEQSHESEKEKQKKKLRNRVSGITNLSLLR